MPECINTPPLRIHHPTIAPLPILKLTHKIKSVYESDASGFIIESRMEVGKGNVATVIVTRGTLKQGDFLYAGSSFCRVKSMFDHTNKILKTAIPGTPVDIMGWDKSPTAGDQFISVKSQKEAKTIADKNKDLLKNFDDTTYSVETRVDDMMKLLQEGELNSINIILKADTNGSVEAIKDGLLKLSTEEIDIEVVQEKE